MSTSPMNVALRAASVRDPLIGMRVEGRYVIERVHGRGGTSIVYAGTHEELQAEVAIKVLDQVSAADPLAVERFALEARLGSSLAHGNLVGVSDFGHLPDGRPYLVMPMIAGIDMATLLAQEGPQHPRRVAKLLHGVASALGLMHARGFVHRDIKSENLMYVAQDDGTETALVLDFGIAASRAQNAHTYADSSGTPEFMPPEAWSGELSDYRGDIYSLATVAFELMTGSLPFEGGDLAELRHRKTTEPARTLTQASERKFPVALEAVMACGLAQRPEERPGSASEFVNALQAAAESMPEWSQRPTARRRASVHPTLVGTGSGIRDRASVGVPLQSLTQSPAQSEPAPKASSVRTVLPSGSSRAATLKRLSERAASVSSSIPAPPPVGAQAPLSLPASTALSASLRALVREAEAPAQQATTPSDSGTAPALGDGASIVPPPVLQVDEGLQVDETDALLPPRVLEHEFDFGDYRFRQPKLGGRLLAYVALAGLVVLALVVWRHARPAAAPSVSAASTLAPAHVDASPVPVPVEPAAHVAPPPKEPTEPRDETAARDDKPEPAAAAPAANDPLPPQPSAAAEPPPAATSSHVVRAASSKHKKAAAPPVLQITKRSAPDARLSVTPVSVTAPALRGGASGVTAPALRGGASVSAPALRGGASGVTAPALRGGASGVTAPALRGGASGVTAPALRGGASISTKSASTSPSRGKSDSGRARALSEQATDATLRSDFAAAANLYQQAIAADAGYAPAWRGKALVLERTGHAHDAAAAFRQFLKLAPNGPAADKVRERLKALEAAR